MPSEREFIKKAIVGLLDAVAAEHPLRHQPSKANRYELTSCSGVPVEVMFEKNEGSPANIWVLEKAAGTNLIAALNPAKSPASALRTEQGKDGKPLYGRHSALERMPQLGDADLVCLNPESLEDFGQIVDRLRAVAASDL